MGLFFSEYEYIGAQRTTTNTMQAAEDPCQKLNQTTMDPGARRKRRRLPPAESTDTENVGGHVLRAALDMVLLWRSSVRGDHRLVTARSANHCEGSTDQQ